MNRRIQNFDLLATDARRVDALSIAEAGYAAIDVGAVLMQELHITDDTLSVGDMTYRLAKRRVYFVGVGKCAVVAAAAVEKILGDRLTKGIALDVANREEYQFSTIEICIGTHPLPSGINERVIKGIVEMLSACTADDLVLMCISGGGSTLLWLPKAPMTYLDESTLFLELTACGASIQEMNIVRKHTSLVRGGGLARAAYPAEVISLIVSDVPGNDIEFIASGPTVLDTSTIGEAKAILDRYHIDHSNIEFLETPKDLDHFERVTNVLLLTNQNALRAMQEEATTRGYAVTIMTDHMSGEARLVGSAIAQALHTLASKSVLLYGGESTVTLGDTHGAGGRNQELALAVLQDLATDELILPFASDGHDNTNHAGAIADVITRAHAAVHNLSINDFLARHCSYDFFTVTGDALSTGYTGSNVSDFIIAVKN